MNVQRKPRSAETIKRDLADRLHELKAEKSYSVEKFAEQFGAKVNTVRDWLNARVLPRAEAICAIATHFRVTTDWLLGIPNAPKYWNQVRTKAELADDLAEAATRALESRIPPPGPYRWKVDGRRLFDGLVRSLESDAFGVADEERRLELLAGLPRSIRDELVPSAGQWADIAQLVGFELQTIDGGPTAAGMRFAGPVLPERVLRLEKPRRNPAP